MDDKKFVELTNKLKNAILETARDKIKELMPNETDIDKVLVLTSVLTTLYTTSTETLGVGKELDKYLKHIREELYACKHNQW